MKKLAIILALVASSTAQADSYVNGYTRQDGTYVQPHYRSNADSSTYNNYSTQGNMNPYTGQIGSQPAYQQPYQSQPSYQMQPSHSHKHNIFQ